jgi:hypothetical protein
MRGSWGTGLCPFQALHWKWSSWAALGHLEEGSGQRGQGSTCPLHEVFKRGWLVLIIDTEMYWNVIVSPLCKIMLKCQVQTGSACCDLIAKMCCCCHFCRICVSHKMREGNRFFQNWTWTPGKVSSLLAHYLFTSSCWLPRPSKHAVLQGPQGWEGWTLGVVSILAIRVHLVQVLMVHTCHPSYCAGRLWSEAGLGKSTRPLSRETNKTSK